MLWLRRVQAATIRVCGVVARDLVAVSKALCRGMETSRRDQKGLCHSKIFYGPDLVIYCPGTVIDKDKKERPAVGNTLYTGQKLYMANAAI